MKITTIIQRLTLISILSGLWACSTQPIINKFSSRRSVELGREAKLRWEVKNAQSVEILGVAKDLPPEGSLEVKPQENTTYKLIAKSKNQQTSEKSFEIKVYKREAEIKYFYGEDQTTDEKPIELTWRVDNATKVSMEGIKENLPAIGKLELNPAQTTTYKLIAQDQYGGTVSDTFRVEVEVLESFRATRNLVRGEEGILSWKIKQVPHVLIAGEKLPPQGKKVIQLDQDTEFTLEATRENGEKVKKNLLVEVADPYIVYFKESRKYTQDGYEQITLKWYTRGGQQLSIDGLATDLASSDSLTLNPTPKQSRTYTLRMEDGEGHTLTRDLFVEIQEGPLVVGGSQRIFRGEKAQLYWRAKDGLKVNVVGVASDQSSVDTLEVAPIHTKTYQVQVKKNGQVITQEHTVRVVRKNYVRNTLPLDKLGRKHRLYFDVFATDRSNYPEEIKLYVMVTDSLGNFISNLAPPYGDEETMRQFFLQVIEHISGQSYPVKDFKVKEVREMVSKPYDIALSLDYSGSMEGAISALERTVKGFIQNKHPDDRISLVKFDDRLVTEASLSQQENHLLRKFPPQAIENFGGGTALYAGGDEALATLNDSENNKVLILFTDGQENSSFRYFGRRAFKASQLVKNARKNNVKIYAVALGRGVNEELLDLLTVLGDGQMYFVESERDMKAVYQELPRIFRNYYEISFRPTQQKGSRDISLIYNNHVDGTDTTRRLFNPTEEYAEDLDKREYQDDYLFQTNLGKRPVAPPQAVAYFEYNQYRLDQKYLPYLNSFIEYMQKNKTSEIEIHGHTDQVGTEAACLILSENRATTVKRYFVNQGIEAKRIQIKAFGKNKPLWPEEDEDWKAAENRRIELLLLE